ncbi:MAG: hypothetical protein GVY08_04770 [Bacteroidetes bacterium]|nr:hypothetical protein [Bacteroidota bacterium]
MSESEYQEIEDAIGSEESVVGIDAKKTHIMIIHLLHELQTSVERLEKRVDELEGKQSQSE